MTGLVTFFLADSAASAQSWTAAASSLAHMLAAAARPDIEIPWGGGAFPPEGSVPIILPLVQLVVLPAACWWAFRTRRLFHAVLCVLCMVATAVALWSIANVRGTIIDHQIFWISIIGVMNMTAITAVAVSGILALATWTFHRLLPLRVRRTSEGPQ